MSNSEFEQQAVAVQERQSGGTSLPNLSLVLVVATSQINRIVISRTVERAGLKVIAETPEEAGELLERLRPGTVILDGGADNCECDMLFDRLAGLRRGTGSTLPNIILITTANGTAETLAPGRIIDAVVAKPITPEILQPVVMRLVEQAREQAL